MRGLAIGVALAWALLLGLGPAHVALATAPAGIVLGVATGETDEPGSLTPVGHGRFSIQDRVYTGRSVARSVVDEWAACFTGQMTSTEDWALEASKLTGTHQSTVTIRSERAVITLRLRGHMEFPTASGAWELARATGTCADVQGEGRYTGSFSSSSPEFRLTFEGELRS